MTVGGAALIAAPEPTMLSKVAGGATFATGVANIANSGPGLINAGRNLVWAIQDNPITPANLPTSGTTIPDGQGHPSQHDQAGGAGRDGASGPHPCPGIAGLVSFKLRVNEARLTN